MEETHDYRLDRSEWPAGPWDAEPEHKVNWIDPVTNLDCMILRNGRGAWCGYVGLPPGHRHHGTEYGELYSFYNDVHGGLTFSDSCSGHICHVPEPGRPDNVWWLGFDCGHSWDRAPVNYGWGGGTYRTQEYVKKEVEMLAQLVSAFR